MIQHTGAGAASTCAFCGRPIDVVQYRLRPGAGPHGDPSDLEPVPFCSDDWLYLSQGQLPPLSRQAEQSANGGSSLARLGLLAAGLLSAALMVFLVWLLVARVFS
ncbi:hypothetical protein [Knoellia sp. LjRoot47]|uniref:hypothetical protein n=1 Tax=Knoellia sp. LjRoot47 TaxID=3342330 RepID=UPI003ECD296E